MSELSHGYANKREQYLVLYAFHLFIFSSLLPFDGLGYYSIYQTDRGKHARTHTETDCFVFFRAEELSVRMNRGRENGEEGRQSLNLIFLFKKIVLNERTGDFKIYFIGKLINFVLLEIGFDLDFTESQ